MLSHQTIEELQQIIAIEFGRNLTFEETSNMSRDLVGYFDALGKLYHEEKMDNEERPPP